MNIFLRHNQVRQISSSPLFFCLYIYTIQQSYEVRSNFAFNDCEIVRGQTTDCRFTLIKSKEYSCSTLHTACGSDRTDLTSSATKLRRHAKSAVLYSITPTTKHLLLHLYCLRTPLWTWWDSFHVNMTLYTNNQFNDLKHPNLLGKSRCSVYCITSCISKTKK